MASLVNKTILASLCLIAWSWPKMHAQAPASIDIANSPIRIQILAQSPADTKTDLQVICLFRSAPENTLHGSLAEMNEKLKGLLERIRKPELFSGEPGETLLLAPPKGLSAREGCSLSGWAIRRHSRRSGCS